MQILKLLNSNSENPLLIWDNSTRAELMEFLTTEQQNKIRTVSCITGTVLASSFILINSVTVYLFINLCLSTDFVAANGCGGREASRHLQ